MPCMTSTAFHTNNLVDFNWTAQIISPERLKPELPDSVYMWNRLRATCNFDFLFKTDEPLKVTGCHVNGKCGSVSETVQGSRYCYKPLYGVFNSSNSDYPK